MAVNEFERIYCQPSTSSATTISMENIEDESEIIVDIESNEDSGDAALTNNENVFVCGTDEFYFDSDHSALKENEDYRKLLHIVINLESKRTQAIQDLDCLLEIRDDALKDPIKFFTGMKSGHQMKVPMPIEVPEVPKIDWEKYSLTQLQMTSPKHQLTRQLSKVAEVIEDHSKLQPEASKSKLIQPWSPEEQKKLEKLLVKYPPEEIESRRWEKIAKHLENRTPVQVASRVQKYFIKLMRAGMPIPGRQPNLSYLRKPRRLVIRQQPSTFLVSHTPPSMNFNCTDEEKDMDYMKDTDSEDDVKMDDDQKDHLDEEICEELKDSKEYKELLCIRKVLQQKQTSGMTQHVRFKCIRCECEPIIGVRWQCQDCHPVGTVNFCEDCADCNHETNTHSIFHKLEPITHTAYSGQNEFVHFPCSDFNYLDPNYMPVA